jgi:hypothetical protein
VPHLGRFSARLGIFILFICCLTPPGQKAASRGALGVQATTYPTTNLHIKERGKEWICSL